MSWVCIACALGLAAIQTWHDIASERRRLEEMAKRVAK